MAKSSKMCSVSGTPSQEFWKVRSFFLETIATGIIGEYAIDPITEAEAEYRTGGMIADLDAPIEKIAVWLSKGGMVGGLVLDGQRQGEMGEGLKFVSPEFVKIGGKWKATGRATMCQVEVTKGGHSGTFADALVTVSLFVRKEADGLWFRNQRKLPVTMSCGCQNRVRGFVGTLDTTSPNKVICDITGSCDDCDATGFGGWWNGAEMLANADDYTEAVADKLAIDPNATDWQHHDSRPDNSRWQGQAKKGKRHF